MTPNNMDVQHCNRIGTISLFLVVLLCRTVLSDYPCQCSYLPEIKVYTQMSTNSSEIGTLFEFDCKPVIGNPVGEWVSIQFEHQVGFVKENFTEYQSCQGTPPIADILTTPVITAGTTVGPGGATVLVTDRPHIVVSIVTETVTETLPPQTTTQGNLHTGTYIPTCTAVNGYQEFYYNGHRYEIVTQKAAWNDAKAGCLKRGGGLVEVTDGLEQAAVYGAVKTCYGSSVWLGLHDQDHEEQFQWASGAPLVYSFWHPGRQDLIFHGFEDCVEMEVGSIYTGDWQDVVCGRHNAYICEYNNGGTSPTSGNVGHIGAPNTNINTDGDFSLCPSRIQLLAAQDHRHETLGQYGPSCYELVNDRVTWEHGETHCVNHGGHLVTINSANEQAWIEAFMTRHDKSNYIWLGLNDRLQEETFAWSSGEAMNYTNWVTGFHLNHHNSATEDCVVLMPFRSGHWDDVSCGHVGFGFLLGGDVGEVHHAVCEYPIGTAGTGQAILG